MFMVTDTDADDLLGKDEEVEKQIEWEEELEEKYGQVDDSEVKPKGRMAGTGFAKQKKVMEENNFYAASRKKPKLKFSDKTRSRRA